MVKIRDKEHLLAWTLYSSLKGDCSLTNGKNGNRPFTECLAPSEIESSF